MAWLRFVVMHPVLKIMHTTFTTKILDFCKCYYLAFIIFAICAVDQLFVKNLRYDRELLAAEPWRFISAHFVHLGWSHFFMNMGALGLIWLMFAKRIQTWQWLVVIFGSAVVISLGVHFLNRDYFYYVGMSGILHGLISAGVWREWRHDKIYALAVGACLCLKLGYEAIYGAMPGSEQAAGGKVLTAAHLYGAIGGVFFIIISDYCYSLINRRR